MLKDLESAEMDIAVNAAYLFARMLRHRAKLPLDGESASDAWDEQITSEEDRLLRKLCRSLEKAEGRPLDAVDPSRLNEILAEVSAVIGRRLSKEVSFDPSKSRKLLEIMRAGSRS